MQADDSLLADHEHMFELAPVSLWLEDYSALHALFERWRAEGVVELRAHLREDPRRVAECTACLRVLKVNQRTLELFAAASQEQLLANLDRVFAQDMLEQVTPELEALWQGRLQFANQSVNYALDGRRLDLQVRARVLPGHEARWDRVLTSTCSSACWPSMSSAGIWCWSRWSTSRRARRPRPTSNTWASTTR